jgi:hypothetical protein
VERERDLVARRRVVGSRSSSASHATRACAVAGVMRASAARGRRRGGRARVDGGGQQSRRALGIAPAPQELAAQRQRGTRLGELPRNRACRRIERGRRRVADQPGNPVLEFREGVVGRDHAGRL